MNNFSPQFGNNPTSHPNSEPTNQANKNPEIRNNACDQFPRNHYRSKKRKKWEEKRIKEDQVNEFQKDDIEGYKPFKSFDHEIKQGFSIEDLMVKVKGRYPITLGFLEKLEITQLKSGEESDVLKTVARKLCDLLYDYQLANLSEEEKEIIKRRGLLKS